MITFPEESAKPNLKSNRRYPGFRPNGIDAFNAVVYHHFSDGPYFAAQAQGPFDVDRVLADYANHIVRGASSYEMRKGGRRWKREHEQLLFKMDDGAFVFMDSDVSSILRPGARAGLKASPIAE